MPELPEVETTRRGVAPYLEGRCVQRLLVREPRLRWPIDVDLAQRLLGARVESVGRRAKYLLIRLDSGVLLVHLGMSGSLRLVGPEQAAAKHDHVELWMEGGVILRYNDPRRFGAWIWCGANPDQHALLRNLGPEPLSDELTGSYLHQRSQGRRQAIKNFVMDNRIVVGVGNIYANEALFEAGIDPRRAAGRVSLARYERLVACIKRVLQRSIQQGGTTLKDFVGGDGKPGYFQQSLKVYGREGQPCVACGKLLERYVIGQRATVLCPSCQR